MSENTVYVTLSVTHAQYRFNNQKCDIYVMWPLLQNSTTSYESVLSDNINCSVVLLLGNQNSRPSSIDYGRPIE